MADRDAERRVERWGLVDSDGSVDVDRVSQLLAFSAVTTIVYAVIENVLRIRDAMVAYYDEIRVQLVDVVETYVGIPVTVLEAARAETVEWFDLFGAFSYPIAIVMVVGSIVAVYWGVRWYV